MKTTHWTAVLILASMVGGITFVMVYLGGSRAAPQKRTTALASLTFGPKRYPEEGTMAQTTEINQFGHQDFWFHNENEQEVVLGLNGTSCKCSSVEVSIAPESWKPRLLAAVAARSLQKAPRGLVDLPTAAAAYQGSQTSPNMNETDAKTTELTRETSLAVPAGAIGWVRLLWRGDKAEPRTLNADLWMNQKGGSVNAQLEVGTVIVEPMIVEKEVSADSFGVRDLEKGKTVPILCWSATRSSFRLKAERVGDSGKADSDSFEVGVPAPLTPAQMDSLKQKNPALPILSGYQIPVTLRAKAKDETPFQLGHFRRFVKLTSDDEGIEPVQVAVAGVVLGDVRVGGPKERGAVYLGPFQSSRGAKANIVLQTDVSGFDLELDSSRLPNYVKVRFPKKPQETTPGHRMWLLEVEVPPNKARGQFPRHDDPDYRDSAIYVKTIEKTPRSIRIPVVGTANEG